MMKNGVITVNGISRLRAWKRGFLSTYLANGIDLHDLIRELEPHALFRNDRNNLIVTSGLGLVAQMLNDEEDVGLTYHAIGTGATTPVIGDTVLDTESNRKLWTSKIRTGAVVSYSVFYLANESDYDIEECGVFGGATASLTPDSGTLFSHYLQAYDNSAGLVDLTFEYELTVGVP
jgi:hypothetical protein